ncbi:MAG: hypothetical protein JXA57_17835 [Armatimonadetes bacterium]|nr:hypothetical protein [Armatimonadota bacterium]
MVRFHVKADAYFEAKDIDDAFRVLARHFAGLARGADRDSLFLPDSHWEIRPADDKGLEVKL